MDKITLTRQEIYDLVWSTPLLTISKKYVISDTGMKKICKRMNIPLPQLGHRQKIKYTKNVKSRPLPKGKHSENEITLNIRGQNGNHKEHPLSTLARLEKEIEANPLLPIKVPKRLFKPDKLIIAAGEDLIKDKQYYSQYHRTLQTYIGKINIKVAPINVNRALLIMDTLIKLLRVRGHDIYVGDRKTYAIIEGENIEIHLREKNTVSDKTDQWGGKLYETTGILALVYGDSYNWKEIKDGDERLEEKMAKVLAKLELEGNNKHKQRIEIEKYWQKEREKEQKEKEKKERIEKEYSDFKELLYEANQWEQSRILRNYINKVEEDIQGNLSEEKGTWIKWAKQKADWFDPLVKKDDQFLKDNDRKKVLKII